MTFTSVTRHAGRVFLFASCMTVAANGYAAGNWYAGVDMAQMASEVTFPVETVEYKTNHLRLKGGYEMLDWLAFEGQLLTDGGDDHDSSGTEYSTGATLGAYVKPHAALGNVDVYALVGFATATSSIDCRPSCPPPWEATLDGPSYGAGLQFRVNENLRISADYMVYFDDNATYDDEATFAFTVDQKNTAIGIGVSYAFK